MTNGGSGGNAGGGDRVVGLAREWDRDKILARDRDRDRRRGGRRERSGEVEEEDDAVHRRPASTKSLEELFNKTASSPAIYWKPLTTVKHGVIFYYSEQGCGSAFIVCGSGSSYFSQCGTGSSL